MKYCTQCVMPDTKPGVTLDKNGLCNACRNIAIKKAIDWEQRKSELIDLCNRIKQQAKDSQYDCIVPVSGGKDGTFQIWYMQEICKMRVLAVSIVPHLRTREGIENLNNMITELGVDTFTITLKPSTYRHLRRKAFEDLGEPNFIEHTSLFAGVSRIAHNFQIPLTVWGEDISFEFGGRLKKKDGFAEDIMDSDVIKSRTITRWYNNDSIKKKYTYWYHRPPSEEMNRFKLTSIYLGYYLWWDGYKNYLTAKKVANFQPRKKGPLSSNILDYDNIDEKLCEINIWLKFIKFGIGRVIDGCCYHIWNGRMTREQAIEKIESLQYEFPIEYFQDFLDFHYLTQEEFWEIAEKYRNQNIWDKINGRWRLKYPINQFKSEIKTDYNI